MIVFNYGGGRQTVAMCVLIAKGILPKPDCVVIADTGRENPMTWEYMESYTSPLLESMGLSIEVAAHSLATVDLYSGNGDLLLPVFTAEGKLPGYCSNEWKRRVVDRHLRSKGIRSGVRWLGLAFDEKRRWKRFHGTVDGKWNVVCPLVDLMLNTHTCMKIISDYGWPAPHHSSCWMCPHKSNEEWRSIRDHYPGEWKSACDLDDEIRENDDRGGVYLHHSRVPLRDADLGIEESAGVVRQCSLGMCFI